MNGDRAFVHDVPASRVVFGAGALGRVTAELDLLGCDRVLLISTPSQSRWASALMQQAGDRIVLHVTEVAMHVPVEVVAAAHAQATASGIDGIVALGGGSAIGLAKALVVRTTVPVLAVPTTYSGSEMTPIWGVTRDGRKETGRDARVLPRTVVYDPVLTMDLPIGIAAASGMNALAHLVEGLYSPALSPLTAIQAEEGVRALAASLPRIVAEPVDGDARAEALYGAWLAGWTLGTATMGLHHRICHVLGGTFGLAHAETHSAVLPYVAAFNASAAPVAMATVVRGLVAAGAVATDAPSGIWDLATSLGAPTSLAQVGLSERDVDDAAVLIATSPPPNPRPVDAASVAAILRGSLAGSRPSSGRH